MPLGGRQVHFGGRGREQHSMHNGQTDSRTSKHSRYDSCSASVAQCILSGGTGVKSNPAQRRRKGQHS
jgi:hypothetical protein